VSLSAIGSVCERVFKSTLEIILRASLGAYGQAGWEIPIACNCECRCVLALECT